MNKEKLQEIAGFARENPECVDLDEWVYDRTTCKSVSGLSNIKQALGHLTLDEIKKRFTACLGGWAIILNEGFLDDDSIRMSDKAGAILGVSTDMFYDVLYDKTRKCNQTDGVFLAEYLESLISEE